MLTQRPAGERVTALGANGPVRGGALGGGNAGRSGLDRATAGAGL